MFSLFILVFNEEVEVDVGVNDQHDGANSKLYLCCSV